ncbi:hypothetical protein Q5P01_015188 [Channa striata]|uniref:Uncharacterized protein n=1 Tax=Channa striata TaxID=64152 RepID=A0AA88MGV0_CHASR|nr:hypothetical protein Q5P01_015188 [Channa striata]
MRSGTRCSSSWFEKFHHLSLMYGSAKAPLRWHETNNTQLPGWLQPIYLQDELRRIEIRAKQKETERMRVREHLVLQMWKDGGRGR